MIEDHTRYNRADRDEAHYANLAGEQYIGFVSKQLACELLDEIRELRHVDRTNADLVETCNRMDVMMHEKDGIIQKLKRDVEALADRRNELIGQKSEIISALWSLFHSLPPSLQCSDFPSHDGDAHFGPCPKVGKFMEAKEKAEEIILRFIRKPKL